MQPTNPTPNSSRSRETKKPNAWTKQLGLAESIGTTVIVFCCLGLYVWWENGEKEKKAEGKHSDKTAASSVEKTRFKYIFDGTYLNTDGSPFIFDEFIRDIYAGSISDDMLNHCLLYPNKTHRESPVALQQVLKDYLLFECRTYRETHLFALKRDSFCEPKFQKLFAVLGGRGGFTDYFSEEAIAFDGWADFRTKGGFARNLPAFKLVPNPPTNK
jgi:hypothetical protein